MGFFEKNALESMKIIRLEWEDVKQVGNVFSVSSFTGIGYFHISWEGDYKNAREFTLKSSVKDYFCDVKRDCEISTNECHTLDEAKELAQDMFENAVMSCVEPDEDDARKRHYERTQAYGQWYDG